MPGLSPVASRSGMSKRSSSGSRWINVARTVPGCTNCPVRTVRDCKMPADGARTNASRRSSAARSSATLEESTSALAVATRVRQVSISSPGTSPGLFLVAVSRRSSPASASASAARDLARVARAAPTASSKRCGSISMSGLPAATVCPSANLTFSTTPVTRAVTWISSNASTVPTADTT